MRAGRRRTKMRRKNPTLMDAQELLTDPGLTEKDSLLQHEMFKLGGLAEEAAALLSQAADETVGGIKANALSYMAWLKSKGMARLFAKSDFRATDINNGHTTVYYVLPPELQGIHER